MTSWNRKSGTTRTIISAASFFIVAAFTSQSAQAVSELRFVQIAASDKHERSAIANLGVSIEDTRSDSVWGFATENAIKKLENGGFKILGNFDMETARGGHENMFDFPVADARYHNYSEMMMEISQLQASNEDIVKVESIGKSTEGRDLWAIHINTTESELASGQSNKPGAIFMGNHHAREHLSAEIPLMLAQYLMSHRRDQNISNLLNSRDIWIIPMVNPDGAEWDISTSRYKMWRKNRRNNNDGTFGVDLNRNYGYGWGTGGSDKETSSDVYMGPGPFSEPESQAIRDFVTVHLNAKILLSFHTFSELILYPWGGKNDPVPNERDRKVFETMARKMAEWNHYTPEQASDLYIASGDTTDWAYGTYGIFAFTFELSPKNSWGGAGFYPGAGVIDKVFNDNLRPVLYMIDAADDPYKTIGRPTSFLNNYVEPVDSFSF